MTCIKGTLSNIVSGLLFIVLGVIIIRSGGIPLRQFGTGWLAINEKAAVGVGILVILCGVYPLYLAVKNFRKSRRS